MRLLLAVCATWGFLLASAVGGEPTFPYKAFVTADDVYVRSGPGQSYYPTERLKAGQEVEIYRHDPGGWYAIRPPKDSFSWVAARHLTGGADELAIVTADRVAARVGTRFSDIRDVIQVRLHKGEVVEVLDAKKLADSSGTKTWYKIAPPSGEFRWIFGKYVDPDYTNNGIRKTGAAEGRAIRTAGAESAQQSHAAGEQLQELPAFAEQTVAYDGIEAADAPKDRELPEQDYAAGTARNVTPEEFRAALEEINLELSAMVVEEPTVWSFADLRHRASSLMVEAQTALERGQTRILVAKMDRFTDIKLRHDTVVTARAEAERSNRRLAGSLRPEQPAAEPPNVRDDRFDGSGQLTRVVSPKLGAPRYALLDERGDVRCYVSPAPGANLRHYLGRRVGVNGARGYMPEQRAQHIMAQHVSLLEGPAVQ